LSDGLPGSIFFVMALPPRQHAVLYTGLNRLNTEIREREMRRQSRKAGRVALPFHFSI
jgi:hypothetical protein